MAAFAKFYNKMPFEIKMRAMWMKGNPPIVLAPGATIEGPYDLLAQYTFLQMIPIDFHRVESVIQGPNYEYKDELLPVNNNVQIINGPTGEQDTVEKQIEKVEQTAETAQLQQQTEVPAVTAMPFDPKTANWLSIKVEELLAAARFLNIDVSSVNTLKPKEKKWALVKMVKAAIEPKQ